MESRVVIVGYGMGAQHARLINEVDELTLVGVCDVDKSKLDRADAENPGISTYTDYAHVLDDFDVDCVVIVTPHNTHAAMAIAAMDAGKHVVTDKAMCLTVADAREMIGARDRNGVLLTTFHNRRWDSEFLTVRKLIDDGVLGHYHIQSCVTSFGQPGGWRTDREQMGGWLYDWGAHTLDQILLLVKSKPVDVYAFAHHRYDDPSAVEDYINCTVTFESGVTATTVIGYINRIEMPRWYVIGELGALQADDFTKPLMLRKQVSGMETETTVPLLKGNWRSFYENVADALAGRSELEVTPEQLIPQIAISEAAYRSVEAKQVVPVVF